MAGLDGIVEEFVEESRELLSTVGEDIMNLEAGHDDEVVNRVYRAFHSIKGNASMLGFKSLSVFAHKTEDMLSLVRNRQLTIDKPTADVLLKAVDTITQVLEDIRDGSPDDRDTGAVVSRIEAVIGGVRSQGGKPGTQAASAPVQTAPVKAAPVQAAAAQPATPLVEPLHKVEVPVEVPSRRINILIVEDDFTSRQILNGFLSRYGDCHMAKDGVEAIEAFTYSYTAEGAARYDLICMDVKMPKLDGTQAARKIREIERQMLPPHEAECAIVMTSAVDDPATIIKACYECGANHYFVKPLDFTQMKRQLAKLGLI